MAISDRFELVLVKIESTQFTDPTPTPAANAILVKNVKATPLRTETENRNLQRAYFGGSEDIPVLEESMLEFDVELQGSGTAGTAPAFGPLLKAAGFAETISAGVSVAYNPISASFNTVYVYRYNGLHKMQFSGSIADVSFSLSAQGLPNMHFKLLGKYVPVTDAAMPSGAVYTAFQIPTPVIPANEGTWTIGGYAAKMAELTINMQNVLNHAQWINQESIGITDRNPAGQISFEAVTVASKDYFAAVRAATLQALVATHGTVAGFISTFTAPKMQLSNIEEYGFKGFRAFRSNVKFVPNTGNDELILTFT
jgi:hypothetical protein